MATFTYTYGTGFAFGGTTNAAVSSVSVYGSTAALTNVSIKLGGLAHSFPDDIDMQLVGPDGEDNLVFWSDAGNGLAISGNYVIEDGAAALPDANLISPGTYAPTNYDIGETTSYFGSNTSIVNLAAPSGSATFASSFSGDPTGTWALYIKDDYATADNGSLQS